MDVLHQLERRGVAVYNRPRALESCIDKYMTTALLESAGLPVPATLCCQDSETALAALDALGGDVIVKPLFGSEGRGLVRITDPEIAWRTFRTLERLQSVIYVQQFIPHEGWDLRVFVLDGEVLTAMRRRAAKDWRTNIAQGGAGEPVDIAPEVSDLALRAAAVVGTTAAGVDLLLSRSGQWFVLEVNAVPGWRRLAAVTQVDIARAMIQSVVKAVQQR
jgi:ribosomal protein S6--L-glutamate ligase